MLTAKSTDNITNNYQGKRLIFGLCGSACFPSSSGLTYSSISETWLVNTPCTASTCDVRLWNGAPYSPATGIALNPTTSYEFLVGANRLQESLYYYRASGSAAWNTTATVNSSNPAYVTGKAGTTYFVVTTAGSVAGNWTLTFTGASKWTQP